MRTTREAWIEQGLTMLAEGGPDAVRVEPLANALGVTKGGFYGQFADRQELLVAMLDAWEKQAVDDAISGLGSGPGDDPRENIRLAGLATMSHRRMRPIDLAVREWARRDDEADRRLRRVDQRRMAFLRSQFAQLYDDPEEVEARSLLAFCLAVGEGLLATGRRGRQRVVDDALRLVTG